MKNYVFLYISAVSVFLFSSYAQKTEVSPDDKKVQETQTVPKNQSKMTSTPVKSYHVEEKINTKFGGYTTTYDVLDPNHINTNNLGPKNTRVITPRFVEEEKIEKEKVQLVESNSSDNNHDYNHAYVYMIKTYEKVAEKGYKSVDIFQKLGNCYFFNSEMNKASRWYCELFEMTSDLEPEYYYRYAKSLTSIGENDKANEILEKINKKSQNNNK